MIPSAPIDFWQRVIDRVARMIFENETRPGLVTGNEPARPLGVINPTPLPTVGRPVPSPIEKDAG